METVDSILNNFVEKVEVVESKSDILKRKLEDLKELDFSKNSSTKFRTGSIFLIMSFIILISFYSIFEFLNQAHLTEREISFIISYIFISCIAFLLCYATLTIHESLLRNVSKKLNALKEIKKLIEETNYETRFSFVDDKDALKGIKVIVEGNIAGADFVIKENSKSFTSYINSTEHRVIVKAIREIARKQETFFRK